VRNPISTDLCQLHYCSSLTAVGFDSVFLTFDRRHQTDQYRLISAAVGVLVLRSLIGAGTVLGAVPMPVHHFVEHSFDFLIAAMILSNKTHRHNFMYSAEAKIHGRISYLGFAPVGYYAGSF